MKDTDVVDSKRSPTAAAGCCSIDSTNVTAADATELCADLDMSRQAVTQHLDLLKQRHLVVTTWRGRREAALLNAVPLQEIYDRWIGKFERSRVRAMRDSRSGASKGTKSA